jgi:hypothetical protein
MCKELVGTPVKGVQWLATSSMLYTAVDKAGATNDISSFHSVI